MAYNTGTTESKNNQIKNNSYQSNFGNRQGNRYDKSRKNSKGSGSPYQNRYPKDSRKQTRRDGIRYEKEGKPKHYNNGYDISRNLNKVQIEESVEEIKNDIERLYKEIKVEIDLIKSIKFFLGYTAKENTKVNDKDN